MLSAAQETFLKVAILNSITHLNQYQGQDIIQWTNEGLKLSDHLKSVSLEDKQKMLLSLSFPSKIVKNFKEDKDFRKININHNMLLWAQEFQSNFRPWRILAWSCTHYRDQEQDLRNQLMHNLRGIEPQDVINYLIGYEDYNESLSVMDIYHEKVKQPFMNALDLFKLPYHKEKLRQELDKLADSLSSTTHR